VIAVVNIDNVLNLWLLDLSLMGKLTTIQKIDPQVYNITCLEIKLIIN